tara:strand:- start:7978 stop:8112 length:135 start_codon:yes stop_codon:yes gene_type:complete
MAKKPKKKKVKLDPQAKAVGKRNLYILLTLAAVGAGLVIVGSSL